MMSRSVVSVPEVIPGSDKYGHLGFGHFGVNDRVVGEGRKPTVSGEQDPFNADVHLLGGAPVPNGFGPGVTWGRIMLHELGHVVGLGHVSDPNQVMHGPITDPSSATNSAYGIGDLAGLRLLGRQAGCQAIPAVRVLRR